MNENNTNIDVNEKQRKNARRVASLSLLIFIVTVILIVGTYAWFIGTSSVKTTSFSIKVATDENLKLSLNGKEWTSELTIEKGNATAQTEYANLTTADVSYSGNTNHWLGSEDEEDAQILLPVSTAGVVDATSSRLTLYEKSSITATAGGYRLIANRINNYGTTTDTSDDSDGISGTTVMVDEGDTYVTFDMFIQNGKDPYYITKYNREDDEAIYLTTDSKVEASPEGATDPDYGIANSIRVAFAQIGRVASTTSAESETSYATITNISCIDTFEAGYTVPEEEEDIDDSKRITTGLCDIDTENNITNTTIWEPNDKNHDSRLITYFNSVCKKKTVDSETNEISYSNEACDAIVDGTATPTYVISTPIASSDNVDIYDGINDYDISAISTYKLKNVDTFTDTEKMLEGAERPAFMYLAPNSITKVRIYIYLEGQDVDNYDLISKGYAVKINFGFTKDQRNLMGAS